MSQHLKSEEIEMGRGDLSASFAMESGAEYGDPDPYFIEVTDGKCEGGTLSFASFQKLEDFYFMLSEYVAKERRRRAGK